MKANTNYTFNNYCKCSHMLYVRGHLDKYYWARKSVMFGNREIEEKFVFDYQKFRRSFV